MKAYEILGRKKPEPTNSRLNHLDQEKSSSHITSCLEEDQNSHDLARQTAEHGNDHCALSASNPERSCHDDALSIANEQLPESDPGNETAFDDDTELQQPRKRRKLEPAEALLSWDEQLRSYARGAPGDLADHDVLDSQDKESPEPEGCFGSVVANGDHFGIESQPGGAGVDVNVPKSPITVSKTQEGSDGEISANGDIAPEAQSICEESNSNGGTLPHEIPTQGNKKASLKFDSKGKLVVPGVTLSERSKKRRTNRVSRSGNGKLKKLIITIPYGKDEASRVQTAARIDAILSTDRNSASATNVIRTSKAKGCEEKALHPFFLPGNRNQAPSTQQHSPSDKSVAASSGSPENTKRIRNSTAATPGKLRAQAKAMQADSALNMSIASTEGTGKRASKYSGSSGVLWPSQGMVHIRGSFSACTNQPENQKTDDQVRPLALKRQKGKDSKTPFEQDLQQLFRMADSTSARSYDTTLSSERLLISGKELQKFVSKQLSYHVRDIQLGQRPDMSKTRSQDAPAYSQFFRQFERIASGLTPFDRGLREAESWAQKYAPSRAEDVLQSGSEPMALRDWLQTLAVKAVEKGLLGDVKTQSSRKDQITGLKKKKRKKHDDVDGFIVSTDDEDDMMEQVEELEDDTLHAPGSKPSKSIFRVGDLTSNSKARMTNAVLLSGPHGSGKSATVYAVAKELGFEVFELNSGSRRGGKELLEKVGDMAENHLYQSTSEDQSNVASDGDNTRLGSALEKDLNTGRQGTMTSFFAPKALSTSKSGKTSAPQKPASKPKSNQSRSSSTQKQSLILLEEVDVLFEEDKNFWFSLTTLALSSKRPIVMTCNEESLVPVDSLNLHAILRFSPPSVDMVTDYLLLMAANEGHLIRRAAISDLFQSRRQDVRATIQQLDFLCQIGIQDRKGGLEWIYQRWPPGVDADADGNRLRVVSKDTFVENPNNQSLTSDPTSLGISAASHESSQQYTVEDAKMPAKDDSAKDIVHDVSAPEAMKKRPDILRTLELALDGRSAADIFCEAGSAFEYKVCRLLFFEFSGRYCLRLQGYT